MTQFLANAHLEEVINGHMVTGLAQEERPFELLDAGDMFNIMKGEDGGLYGTVIPELGQAIATKVQPASPTAQWFMQQKQMWRNSIKNRTGFRTYRCTLTDPAQGRVATLSGGVHFNVPNMSEPGVTYVAVIRYELIDVHVDAATFRALFGNA